MRYQKNQSLAILGGKLESTISIGANRLQFDQLVISIIPLPRANAGPCDRCAQLGINDQAADLPRSVSVLGNDRQRADPNFRQTHLVIGFLEVFTIAGDQEIRSRRDVLGDCNLLDTRL